MSIASWVNLIAIKVLLVREYASNHPNYDIVILVHWEMILKLKTITITKKKKKEYEQCLIWIIINKLQV